jgi:hypothetical protein
VSNDISSSPGGRARREDEMRGDAGLTSERCIDQPVER